MTERPFDPDEPATLDAAIDAGPGDGSGPVARDTTGFQAGRPERGDGPERGGGPERGDGPGPDDAPAHELTTVELEGLLFVAERPLTRREIATLAGVHGDTVDARLGDLEVDLAGRGIRLLVAGDRVALATAPEAGSLVARYVGAEGVRLTPAALETLAIVAYRQPVTRAVIERIRGVDSDYVVRSLLHRRLIVEQGRSEAPGRPFLYGTSFEFLERFGLTSLDELPPVEAEIAARLAEAEASADDDAEPPQPVQTVAGGGAGQPGRAPAAGGAADSAPGPG